MLRLKRTSRRPRFELDFETERKAAELRAQLFDPQPSLQRPLSMEETRRFLGPDGLQQFLCTRPLDHQSLAKYLRVCATAADGVSADMAAAVFKEKGVAVTPYAFSAWISSWRDRPQRAEEVFQEFLGTEALGSATAANVWRVGAALMSVHAFHRDISTCERLLSFLQHRTGTANEVGVSVMLNALAEAKDTAGVFSLYEHVRRFGSIQPDRVMYTTLIKTCLADPAVYFAKAKRFHQDMESEGISPNTYSVNTLLNVGSRTTQFAVESADLYRKYASGSFPDFAEDRHTFCALAQACANAADVLSLWRVHSHFSRVLAPKALQETAPLLLSHGVRCHKLFANNRLVPIADLHLLEDSPTEEAPQWPSVAGSGVVGQPWARSSLESWWRTWTDPPANIEVHNSLQLRYHEALELLI